MKLTRRDFLKIGFASTGMLASIGLFGCSPQQSATNSNISSSHVSGANEITTNEGENMNTNEPKTETSTAVGAAASVDTPAVVYFSCTGNTETVAKKIAAATDGVLMRIEAAEPYTSADLDYNSDCRANTEQNSSSARPAIAAPVPDVANYDTVYLGYPIWWGKAPRIILTFLEGVNLAGKTIIPFCTSGSSPISGSIDEIKQAASGATVLEGRRFSASVSQQEIDSWRMAWN